MARLAIVGSAGRKTCRTGRLWSWAFPARSLGLATAAAQDTVKLRFRACERVLANGGADETLGHRSLNRNYDYIYTYRVGDPLCRYLERHSRASRLAGKGRIYRISAN